jgi:anti-sigma B factor antagonist
MTATVFERNEAELSATELAPAFELHLRQAGRTVLARVNGPLDLHHSPQFLNRMDPFQSGYRRVVVDLRDAEYVDSAGVRALLLLHRNLASSRSELRLVVKPGSRVERVLRLLKLDSYFHLYQCAVDAWGRDAAPEPAALVS